MQLKTRGSINAKDLKLFNEFDSMQMSMPYAKFFQPTNKVSYMKNIEKYGMKTPE